jgi:hypothetical protein
MDIRQPYQRYIPEQKDEKEKDQTGEDQQSDEDPLFWSDVQNILPKNADCGMQNAEFYSFSNL